MCRAGAEQDSKDSTPRLSRRVVVTPWEPEQEAMLKPPKPLFTPETQAIIYGMQPRACQGMLDFDLLFTEDTFCCGYGVPLQRQPQAEVLLWPQGDNAPGVQGLG